MDLAQSDKEEGNYFKGFLLGIVVLAYFTGFIVRYVFLDRLGLSIASTALPVYYLCVYSYDVLTREWWALVVIVLIALVVGAACWARPTRPTTPGSFVVWCVYPALMTGFVFAFPLLAIAAQKTADAQVLDLYGPRHELGTRLVLNKQFVDEHCGNAGARRYLDAPPSELRRQKLRANPLHDRCRDADVGALLEAAEDARLILIAESAQDLIFFERPAAALTEGAFPATRVYRVRKADAALASTRIGP
jgi:hypothetical protein